MQARPRTEVPAASLAAEHRSQQDIDTLREILGAMEKDEAMANQSSTLHQYWTARIRA